MKTQTKELISNLTSQVNYHISFVERLLNFTDSELNLRLKQEAWTILECIEHLNLYSDFYLQEIGKAIDKSQNQPQDIYKSTFLGNWFAESMLPKSKINTMKTARKMNPIGRKLNLIVLEKFLGQQQSLLHLLQDSANRDINRIKIKTTISPLIKLNLGDALRFVIYHNERHLKQVEKYLEQIHKTRFQTSTHAQR